jgi:hypothetical protein
MLTIPYTASGATYNRIAAVNKGRAAFVNHCTPRNYFTYQLLEMFDLIFSYL